MTDVMIVAAEASSMIYAQRLLEYWKREGRNVRAFGVGSREMEAMGFERLGKSEDMAVVGIGEIISHYGELKAVFNRLVEKAKERRPKVVILMDYPEFNLMLSKKLHALGIPVVYYISPQVWAWRKGRVHTIKKYCKKVLLLFPFEVPFYSKFSVPYEFVGHPILDELDPKLFDEEYLKTHRNQCGIADNETVLGLMPGSRRLELKFNFPTQIEVAENLRRKYKNLKVLIMVAPTFDKEQLHPYLENVKFPYIMLKDEPFKMIHLADIVLATSGTATLMVGLLKKPMVIMYRTSWLTSMIGRMVVKGYFGLVNLILGREVVPERLQEAATAEKLVPLVERYITDKEYYQKTVNELATLYPHLGDRGVTQRAAKAIEEFF